MTASSELKVIISSGKIVKTTSVAPALRFTKNQTSLHGLEQKQVRLMLKLYGLNLLSRTRVKSWYPRCIDHPMLK